MELSTTPPFKGVPIISSEIELLEIRGAILLTLFSDSEFPWGAILSDFLRLLVLKTQKISRAYGAILPFRNDQDTVQNRIFFARLRRDFTLKNDQIAKFSCAFGATEFIN